MKYHIRNKKTEEILGPFSVDEISSQLRSHTITDDYEAHESSGQSFTVLRHSDDWVPVSRLFETPSPAESSARQTAKTLSSVGSRYSDAYLVAKTTSAIGIVVKAVGIILGLLVAIVGIVIGVQHEGAPQMVLGGVLLGIIVALPLWVLGVLVCAQAQVLKATLDTAVHSSPFLNKDEMARVMSL